MNLLPLQKSKFQIKTLNNTLMHQSHRHHAAAGWLIILGCVTADAKYVYRLFPQRQSSAAWKQIKKILFLNGLRAGAFESSKC